MYIDFEELPDAARVWVYQANRSLTQSDIYTIQETLQQTLSTWAAHGQPLMASARIVDQRFIALGVNEGYNLPSGCSIDASVRTLQALGQRLAIDFFDRSAAVKLADGAIQIFPLSTLKSAVADGIITTQTTVVNTLVKTKAEFLTGFYVPAENSWLKRYFKVTAA